MFLLRNSLALLAFVCFANAQAGAQEADGGAAGAGPSGSSSGSESSAPAAATNFGSEPSASKPSPGASADVPYTSPASAAGDPGAGRNAGTAPSFRTTPNASQAGGVVPGASTTTGGQPATEPGATTTFGAGAAGSGTEAPAASKAAPSSFEIPGGYGRAPLQFTAGEGRLARPRFRTTGSVSIGYDDNIFQTPTDGQDVPERKVRQQIAPATEGRPAQFRTLTVPGIRAPERQGSLIVQSNAGFDVQFVSRRTLFTFDITGGASYYCDRPRRSTEFEGALSLIYLRKITNRLQFTASVNAAYTSQPDLSQVNTPTQTGDSSYLTLTSKADISYRLTPRFSSVTSVSYNTLRYEDRARQPGNYSETVFGTELRYLFSPRLTLLGELRYSSVFYDSSSGSDASTFFFLVGGEMRLSRRFSATLRVGDAVRSNENGGTFNSPYLENTLSYQLARGTSLQLSNRYGFEETSSQDSQVRAYRGGLNLAHAFSPKLRASAGLFFVDRQIETGNLSTSEESFQAALGLEYTLDRHWSFNLNYTYTSVFSSVSANDYYRNRIFLGAVYQF